MALDPVQTRLGRALAAWIAVSGLMAAEHHGVVKSGGLPIPGATVTATMGDKKVVTTTDDIGRYAFPNLSDGTWTLEIEMLGFAKLTREVGLALDAPSPEWDLKFLPPPAMAAPAPAPANPTKSAPGTPVPAASAAAAPAARQGRGARGQQAANGGRPSLVQANNVQANNFQRVDVNAAADANAIAGAEGALTDGAVADMSQSADASFVVNGSVSRGLDMPQQNDWFGGPGGRMGMDGMGGPGGMGMDGIGGQPGGGDAMGGGRGGPGGGPGGGRGGPGGGGAFAGAPGGFGGGGFGGRGGPGGGGRGAGRGGEGRGPGGGRPGVASFGNGRRNPRAQYNGNAAFTLDNSVWDARSYSINGQDTAKPAYAKARASVMFGGPLKIPHLFDNSKGSFTFNYQLGRTRNGTTATQTLPTLLERAGDFSQSIGAQGPVTIYDPLTGSPFPGNVIPANRINPASPGLLKFFPSPNGPGYKYNFQTPITTVQNSNNINTRLNQTLTKKDRINGGLGYQGSNNTTPNIFNFIDTGNGHGWNANIAWSHNFTTRVINNLRYTYSRATALAAPFFANLENVAAELGITGTSQAPLNWGPPSLSFTNYASLTDGNSSLTRNQTSAVGESIIWVHGLHNLTFGGDFSRRQNNRFADPNPRGTFAFTGLTTSNIVNGIAAAGTGFDFADFLLGRQDTSAVRYGNGNLYYRTTAYDAYVTDDWRMSQAFTLNFGVRYDYTSPISELFGRMVNLDVAPAFAAIAPLLPGQTGAYSGSVPNSLVRPDRNNFSPRIGFSWRPIPKHSMVVRGGYGIYYNTQVYNTIANNMAQQPPFSTTLSIATDLTNPLTLQNGFIVPPGQIYTNTYAVDPNYRIGYAQIWQLSVQNDLGHSLVGTITYNGTKGTRLDQSVLPNSAPPGARPLPFPSGYIYESSNGDSIYHSASFQLNRRFRNGVSFNANYVFSKAIDNAVQAQDFLDTSAERARSAGSRTHTGNFGWQYSTGVGRGGGTLVNGWKGALLKDWTLQNNITVASGAPLTAIIGGNRSTTTGTGITGSVRANATGLSVSDAPPGEPFNFAAFVAPPAGQFGNAGRNTITGPMQFNLRGQISRVFRIGERRSADLQFAATNALNHVTFSGFNTTIGSNSLGLLTGPSAMRSLTATLRFRF
jgi:hypothetical protein